MCTHHICQADCLLVLFLFVALSLSHSLVFGLRSLLPVFVFSMFHRARRTCTKHKLHTKPPPTSRPMSLMRCSFA